MCVTRSVDALTRYDNQQFLHVSSFFFFFFVLPTWGMDQKFFFCLNPQNEMAKIFNVATRIADGTMWCKKDKWQAHSARSSENERVAREREREETESSFNIVEWA